MLDYQSPAFGEDTARGHKSCSQSDQQMAPTEFSHAMLGGHFLARPASRYLGIGRAILVNVAAVGLRFHVNVRIRRVFARNA